MRTTIDHYAAATPTISEDERTRLATKAAWRYLRSHADQVEWLADLVNDCTHQMGFRYGYARVRLAAGQIANREAMAGRAVALANYEQYVD